MIPFFRKIRKKMADDNKPLKYMRYAIGEIVLVVIGILIALQINNWNEDNKKHEEQFQLLNRLKSDLELDINYFNKRIFDSEKVLKDHLEVLIELYEEQENLDQVANLFKRINANSEMLTIQNSTYIEIINSGKLDIISSIDLKQDFINYYKSFEAAEKHFEEINAYSVVVMTDMFMSIPETQRVIEFSKGTDDFYQQLEIRFDEK